MNIIQLVFALDGKRLLEFMFWGGGAFSWDHKSPFYIWKRETAAQKKAAQKEMDEYNGTYEWKHELNGNWLRQ